MERAGNVSCPIRCVVINLEQSVNRDRRSDVLRSYHDYKSNGRSVLSKAGAANVFGAV